MYDYEHTGNVALRVTVTEVRSGDGSSKAADISVSLNQSINLFPNSLIFTLKKCAESLAVTIVCILSLWYRAPRYNFSTKTQRVGGRVFPLFPLQHPPETIYMPYTSVATRDGRICHARRQCTRCTAVPVCCAAFYSGAADIPDSQNQISKPILTEHLTNRKL